MSNTFIPTTQLRIYNGFGIKPTNTYQSAGMDFYIPNVRKDDTEIYERAVEAICTTYKITRDTYNELCRIFSTYIELGNDELNIIHLFLGTNAQGIDNTITEVWKYEMNARIRKFAKFILVFDKDNKPGVRLFNCDTLFINSGIKVALPQRTCGVFLNKSGMGNKGFDVRSQVIDEDYSGYVHLSLAYTKNSYEGQRVYVGDKVIQMLILPVLHLDPVEIPEDTYEELMQYSTRGSYGFGSSDVKH